MRLLFIIVIGFLAGALAKFVMPGKDPGGIIVTTLLGIGGAVVGGWLLGLLGIVPQTGPMQFITAVLGAIAILFVYRQIKKRKAAA